MFINYLKIALRNLLKYRGYSAINIIGLAIGIACCLLISLYVQQETSYDKEHPEADKLYRVSIIKGANSFAQGQASVSYPTAEVLLENYPEVQAAARIFNLSGLDASIRIGEQQFTEDKFFFAEASLPNLFSMPFLRGNKAAALQEIFAVIVTESTARKYFGTLEVLGRRLTVSMNGFSHDFQVSGVVEDPPENTHFKYHFLASLESFRHYFNDPNRFATTWFVYPFWTYIKLADGADPAALESQFRQLVKNHFPKTRQDNVLFLQPVKDIHLHSQLDNEFEANNDVIYIYIFSAIAALVLVIACINFVNLATARSIHRAREVGIRKVLGAHRLQLIRQYLAESLLTTAIALVLSLGLVELLLVVFNRFTDLQLNFNYVNNGAALVILVIIALAAGLLAGLYPAFFLSSFQPVKTLKSDAGGQFSGGRLRKFLVAAQIFISVILLAGILIMNRQLEFMQQKKLGYSQDKMMMVEIRDSAYSNQENFLSFKKRLMALPEVAAVTRNSRIMGEAFPIRSIYPRAIDSDDQKQITPFLFTGNDFVTAYDLEVLEGRDFSEDFTSEDTPEYILNESAVAAFDLQDPLGREIITGDRVRRRGKIIAVIKDFHFASLHEAIQPLVIGKINAFGYRYASVRLQGGFLPDVINQIRQIWQGVEKERPFSFTFLDDRMAMTYQFEIKLRNVITYFTLLAVFIACLGLLGLAAFSTERRSKEIGIRKVMGARMQNILGLLLSDFVKLALAAILVAWPVIWLLMNPWLENFAYRISIDWWIYLTAAVLALVITVMTVSYQAFRAALRNPVQTLRQ